MLGVGVELEAEGHDASGGACGLGVDREGATGGPEMQVALSTAEQNSACVSAEYAAPGEGGLDYSLIMRSYAALPWRVPIIAQYLTPRAAPRVYEFKSEHFGRIALG